MRTFVAVFSVILVALTAVVPLAIAQNDDAKEWRINGVVEKKQPNQMTIRTDNNRVVVVDTSHARRQSADSIKVGDRVSVVGDFTGRQRMQARAIRELGSASKQTQGDWERIHGRVEAVEGSTLRLRADDGRMLNVDMSNVGSEIRQALTRGERATVIGYEWLGPNRLRAEYIQQSSSDPSRGGRVGGGAAPPRAAKSTAPADAGWQRIHGKVAVIGGNTMDLKTDDGRTLVVDLTEVSPEVVKSLSAGESVTAIGTLRDRSRLDARYVQKDSSDPSRAPSALPRSR